MTESETVQPGSAGGGKRPFLSSLSAKLLLLTVAFVMLAEVLIFTPSIARARLIWLEELLADAYLAALVQEAAGGTEISMMLEDKLLAEVGALRIDLTQPDGEIRMLGAGASMPDLFVNLDDRNPVDLILDAFEVMLVGSGRTVLMTGSPANTEGVRVEVVFDETPLCDVLLDFSIRILALSIFISLITAGLVFLSLRMLLVRPMERFSRTLVAFAADPEDGRNVIRPSGRRDEIGTAERTLRDMQGAVRDALHQKERLAALGTAVAKVNHDLRNILATASLVTEGLTLSRDPDVQQASRKLFDVLDRAVGLCSRTLDYATESTAFLEIDTVPLAPLVDRAVEEARSQAGEGASISLAVPSDVTVAVDADHWVRVLANLIRNAIQAGAGRIEISASTSADPDVGVDIRIVDNGPGLPDRAKTNLFRPFAGSARPGGTGLGLAIVKEIVTAHRGEIRLVSSGPDGTEFAIRVAEGEAGPQSGHRL